MSAGSCLPRASWQSSASFSGHGEHFIGVFLTGRADYEVAALSRLLAKDKRIEPAKSQLGMYPVLLSQPLIELWLKPHEVTRLCNAWYVGYGMKLTTKAIEQNIRESDKATRRAKFEKMCLFARRYGDPWTEEDSKMYWTLLPECQADTRKQRHRAGR